MFVSMIVSIPKLMFFFVFFLFVSFGTRYPWFKRAKETRWLVQKSGINKPRLRKVQGVLQILKNSNILPMKRVHLRDPKKRLRDPKKKKKDSRKVEFQKGYWPFATALVSLLSCWIQSTYKVLCWLSLSTTLKIEVIITVCALHPLLITSCHYHMIITWLSRGHRSTGPSFLPS